MKYKIIVMILIIAIGTLWGANNIQLNNVIEKGKILKIKEKELEETLRIHDSKIMEYDTMMDFEKIKQELEKKGLKSTRKIEYFEVE
ncbi:MAG: hypothetical protein ACRC0S_04430 [Fusobacteriaceae bacterium]